MTGPATQLGAGTPSGETFSVREFARTAVGNYRHIIDLDALASAPLDPALADRLRYLADLERATILFLRRVLVTPTHKDARVTAFLTTWAFEKYWIADALLAVADAGGTAVPSGTAAERPLRDLPSRLSPVGRAIVTNIIGPDIVGAHLATATVDEAIAEEVYRSIAESTEAKAVAALLTAVLATKERHQLFLAAEARARLTASASSRRIARWILPRVRLPIGSDQQPFERATTFWAALDPSRLAAVDAFASALPGLRGTRLASTAATRAERGGSLARRAGRRLGQLARSVGGAHERA